jgi:hypothetical protein
MKSNQSLATTPYEADWEQRLEALLAYTDREGNALVPSNHIERGIKLGGWVSYLRTRYKSGLLSASRVEQLESVPGWEWGPLRPGPKSDESRDEQIRQMREAGMSMAAIGEEFRISRQRIHQILSNRINA